MNEQFRQALEGCDVKAVRSMWAEIAPHLPQPKSNEEVLIAVHYARTAADRIMFKLRAYSHAWLTERNFPSGLPDYLKPKAERLYPRVIEAVGIAVKTFSAHKELGVAIRTAMSDAVMDAYAEGRKDPVFIRGQMELARLKVKKQA